MKRAFAFSAQPCSARPLRYCYAIHLPWALKRKAPTQRPMLKTYRLFVEQQTYLIKEYFYRFMASKNSQEAKQRLHEFSLHAYVVEIHKFSACLTMLRNWEPYILNVFNCPYTNGFTEGCNNTIKVLKRIAFRYRNFQNFRTRILLTLHTKEVPASSSYTLPSITSSTAEQR